ncbi:MAG TPA: hypothetical protein VER58_01090 [Thermoanaerobaculia bacterium]|nr:hypothetical protein [Thermoanaerobaculia bacterium]
MEVTVEFAAPSDDAAIRALLQRQAMPGRVRIAFAREPNFARGCAVTGDEYKIVVARAQGEIVGVACRSVRNVFINGHEQRLGYLGQLRVDDRFRGRWLVSRGFALLGEIDRHDPLIYLASIVDGNHEATGVLVRKGRRSFPNFHEVARYCTLAIPLTRSRSAGPPSPRFAGRGPSRRRGEGQITAGSLDQVPEIVRFLRTEGSRRQLFPVWTEDALRNLDGLDVEDIRVARRDGGIVGVMALWDQTAYKQSIIRGYSGWMKAVAPFLPRAGHHLRSAYASLICATDPEEFAELLREIHNLARERRFDYLLVGLDARDPLLKVARAYRHYSYPSRLYLASWSNGGSIHDQLDHRPAYVDIATL